VFDKLDDQAVKAILAAQEESRRQGHKFVDSEQLLLGLMFDSQGLPAAVLESLGLKARHVRERINTALPPGSDFVGTEIPFTPRLNRLLQAAWDGVVRDGRNAIGTKDLLLSLAQLADGTTGEILDEAGITAETLRGKLEGF
jgi:ATP-dependent Clp protease ATP-binding subunit ClpC